MCVFLLALRRSWRKSVFCFRQTPEVVKARETWENCKKDYETSYGKMQVKIYIFLSGFSAGFDHTLCYSRKDFFTKLYFLNHFLQKAILNQKSIGNQIPLYPPVRRETSGTLVI